MPAERPRRGELAELVADHLLGDEDGHVFTAVVDGDRVADHLREDRRGARPGANHLLGARVVHLLDPALRAIWPPRPGFSSTLCTSVPVGILASGSAFPGRMSADGPDSTIAPTRSRAGARM